MSKPPKKLSGRPTFKDRGHPTLELPGEDTTAIATGRFRALAEGLSLEVSPDQEGIPDPYNQALAPDEEKTRRRSLDDMRLLSEKIKRKREHAELVKRLRNEPRADDAQPARGIRLRLQFEDRELWLDHERSSAAIGRGESNDLMVRGPQTSRLHAHIAIRGDKLVLVDLSVNGTYLQRADGTVSFVNRNSLQFEGRGMIGLGREPMPGSAHTICFNCEKR